MKFRIKKSLEDYIQAGNETTEQILRDSDEFVAAIRRYHDFFANVLWAEEQELGPFTALLSMNAFMIYLSAVRMAFTGHVAATFPLFRTALESACYAYLMSDNLALEAVWLNRNQDKDANKACRRAFQSAVLDTAEKLNAIQSGIGDMISESYEASIDFGAHPNRKSVITHMRTTETDEAFEVNLAGLYSHDSFELLRALVACLDYGLAIAIVLTHCLSAPGEVIEKELQEINDLKNRLVEPFTGR